MKNMPANAGASRKTYIEFLRIAACFLVIVNHTNSYIWSAPSLTWFIALVYFFICKIAVPIFLMIMGALLLGKRDTPRKSLERFGRIAAILAAGSVFYLIYYALQTGSYPSFQDVFPGLLNGPATNAFWYLYLYLALLCLLPVLQKMVLWLDRGDIQWILFLSLGVLGTAPLTHIFFPAFQLYDPFAAALFSTPAGIVLLGYYVERYVSITRRSFWISCGLFVFLIAFQAVGTYFLYQRNPETYLDLALDSSQLITVTASSACFYIMVKYLFSRFPLRPKLERAICCLGGLTFGAYLLGDFIISLSTPLHAVLYAHIHRLPALLLWELLIFTACMLITAGLKCIPPIRKWL